MTAELLDAINTRFRTYAEGGRTDDWLILSEQATAEAQELWQQAASAEGNVSIPVSQVLAWLHWARYNALPEGRDLSDLQAALIFFTPMFRMFPDQVPEQVKEFLQMGGEAADLVDNERIPARRDDSYASRTYPNAVAHLVEFLRKVTHVPMASNDKPDINGFREGDRVKLIAPFNGERSQYPVASTATVLVPNTSPSSIELSRSTGLVDVYLDLGKLIMMHTNELEKIPGRATVTYTADQESFTVYCQ